MDESQKKSIYDTVVNGKAKEAVQLGTDLYDAGVKSTEIGIVLIEAMNFVGHQYRERVIALPQLILATHSFKKILEPYVKDTVAESGKVVMGVVQNDIHDIGKNLVVGMLQVYGFQVKDLGKDVPLDKFIEAAKEIGADIVGAGTLLTATMPELQLIREKMEAAGLRPDVKYMVGGAPITTTFAKKIGAEGYASDAILAVKTAQTLKKGETSYLASKEDRAA
ncbi:MAG: cobalamin-binding protein [Methanomassiliicoccales archaeon]|nr:cobalamin-binding protein [Methanomassiliicoccales archaeon]NYT15886.1 cobalamin-binding protein [Methanomassiliicoccales archaeon]